MSIELNNRTPQVYRNEPRKCKRVFVEVKPLGNRFDEKSVEALTADISDSGISLISDIPLPIGTLVQISLNSKVSVIGEVTNIDNWDHYGIARMGVKFLEKMDDWMIQ